MKGKSTAKNFKERRIYSFLCKCGRKAQSYRRSRAKRELCRVCRRPQVDDRQQSFFDFPVRVDATIPPDKLVMGYDPGTPEGDHAVLIMGERQDDGSVVFARIEKAELATKAEADGSIKYGLKMSGSVL